MSNTFETEVEILYMFFKEQKFNTNTHKCRDLQELIFGSDIYIFKNGDQKKKFFRFSSH